MIRLSFTARPGAIGPKANINRLMNCEISNVMGKIALERVIISTLTLLLLFVMPSALAAGATPYSLDQALNLQPPQQISLPAEAPVLAPLSADTQVSSQSADVTPYPPSDVFGANLFTGAFARQGATQFNPDYAVALGDNIQVRLWGAFQFDASLTVDPKGNIFLPNVGPVQVLGVRNQDIQRAVETAVSKVFRSNVNSYASLAAAQPVRVFVSGFVYRPGLYGGTSMDSLLNYLDQAGGIDTERGSFLNVQVKRGGQIRATVNLYDFLLEGRTPLIQLADGDVIFVSPRQNTVKVTGQAENAKRFEFNNSLRTVADLIKLAKPLARATHVRVVRNTGTIQNTEYYPLDEVAQVSLKNGDTLEFTADKKIGTIAVRVQGKHESAQEYVLHDGAKLGDLIKQIQFNDRSDLINLQLFRLNVQERQNKQLQTLLRSLEATLLTARSGSSEEAVLRTQEAALIMQWVDRAKQIKPSGQVIIAQAANRDDLLLENGDVLNIPTKDGLVLISGEVLFPSTMTFDPALDVDDYLQHTGGRTQNADSSRIIIAHRDGSFADGNAEIRAGDEIMVLPKVEVKSRQIAKELTQIIYQIAVSAKVILGL